MLNAINEQIEYSDFVVLNKIDRVDQARLTATESALLSLNPHLRLLRADHARIDPDVFLGLREKTPERTFDDRYRVWGGHGRPMTVTLSPRGTVKAADLSLFLEKVRGSYYRLKGWFHTEAGRMYVDCTSSQETIVESESSESPPAPKDTLVIITSRDEAAVARIRRLSHDILNTSM